MKRIIMIVTLLAVVSIIAFPANAQIVTQKETALNEMRNIAMEMCEIRKDVDELAAKWVALGYAPAGSNPMTQMDIDAIATYSGLPLSDVQAIISVMGAYRTQMDTWSTDLRTIMP